MNQADAEALADKIVRAANDGYHNRDDYPSYAVTSMTDRVRWTAYLRTVITDVLRTEEL